MFYRMLNLGHILQIIVTNAVSIVTAVIKTFQLMFVTFFHNFVKY